MIEIYEKRGKWCFRDEQGVLHKCDSEAYAILASGIPMPATEEEDDLWESDDSDLDLD